MNSKFAREQLEKHGWTDGSGLGKNEHGIKDAVKVKIKKDSHGVGHDPGEQFSFHWWDHVFNKAASNINVSNNEDGVVVEASGDTAITNKRGKTFANKDMLYGRFVKSATLTNGITESKEESSDSESEDESKTAATSNLTDEELFKVCGGRTAHKGARHGLKLNGKLQRIQEQEAALLAKYAERKGKDTGLTKKEDNLNSDKGTPRNKSKKKKKKKSKREIENDETPEIGVNSGINEVKTKKNKKKQGKKADISQSIANSDNSENRTESAPPDVIVDSKIKTGQDKVHSDKLENANNSRKKSKKLKRKQQPSESEDFEKDSKSDDVKEPKQKKKKKTKK